MNIELALLADYAAFSNDGKLSAAGIFDRLVPLQMPWQHPTMYIALNIHVHPGEEGDHKIKVRLVDPDGQEIVALDADVAVIDMDPVEGGSVRLVLAFNNVPFKSLGRHAFDVFLDGRYEHTIPMVVAHGKQPAVPSSES